MHHKTAYSDLVYLAADKTLAVCRFRLIVTDSEQPIAVVQIDNHDARLDALLDSYNVRDLVVNRILDHQLGGVPLGLIRLVLTDGVGRYEIPLDIDIDDYIQRGNRFTRTHEAGRKGSVFDRFAIESRDLIAGRVRVQTAYATAMPLPVELAALLDL